MKIVKNRNNQLTIEPKFSRSEVLFYNINNLNDFDLEEGLEVDMEIVNKKFLRNDKRGVPIFLCDVKIQRIIYSVWPDYKNLQFELTSGDVKKYVPLKNLDYEVVFYGYYYKNLPIEVDGKKFYTFIPNLVEFYDDKLQKINVTENDIFIFEGRKYELDYQNMYINVRTDKEFEKDFLLKTERKANEYLEMIRRLNDAIFITSRSTEGLCWWFDKVEKKWKGYQGDSEDIAWLHKPKEIKSKDIKDDSVLNFEGAWEIFPCWSVDEFIENREAVINELKRIQSILGLPDDFVRYEVEALEGLCFGRALGGIIGRSFAGY